MKKPDTICIHILFINIKTILIAVWNNWFSQKQNCSAIHFNIRFMCIYKLNCYFTYKIFTNNFRNSLVTYTQLQCSLVFLLLLLVVNRKQQKEIFKEVDEVNYHVNGMAVKKFKLFLIFKINKAIKLFSPFIPCFHH